MKRQQDGKLPKVDQEIDGQTYRNAIVANQESQNEFSVARKKISIKDWILYPTNKYLLRLNFLSCTLVFYDCFMVPFKNTYGSKIFKENEKTLLIVDNITKLIFSLDVFLGFRKAYLGEDG